MNFERLQYLREENDMRQIDVATLLNVNRVNISNWEKSKEIIPLEKLFLYVKHFNTSFDYIIKLTDNKTCHNYINKEIDRKVIGKRLKEFRKNNNITQKELAEFLNTTQSTICAYEKGKTLILTCFAYQICFNYNVSMDWLIGTSNNNKI